MAESFQNPANMTKAQQEIKKEEFDIVQAGICGCISYR
jgi:hypothetical protein